MFFINERKTTLNSIELFVVKKLPGAQCRLVKSEALKNKSILTLTAKKEKKL